MRAASSKPVKLNTCKPAMPTIKQVARESGFSPTTVSIVLRGKADERHISQATKDKVLDAAHRLGYRVNIAARRLRSSQSVGLAVSVFMALDRRSHMMMRFLLGLQSAAAESGQPIEIIIHSYKSGSLHKHREAINLNTCVIICNASSGDLRFLESTQFSIPIVLFFRDSGKYSTVNINAGRVGHMAGEIFARRGHKHAVVLAAPSYYVGQDQSRDQFVKTAKSHGMTATVINDSHDAAGGHRGGLTIGKMIPRPDCVFSGSSIMSLGAIRALEEQGVKIPQDMELISVGSESPELDEYASVPLSTIDIPIELMAKECIGLLLLQLAGRLDEPRAVTVPLAYQARESCGE